MAEENQCIVVTGHVVNFHTTFPYSIDFQTKSQAPARRKEDDDDGDDFEDDGDDEPEEDNLAALSPSELKESMTADDIKEVEPISSESSIEKNDDDDFVDNDEPHLSKNERRALDEAISMHSSKMVKKRAAVGPKKDVPKKEKPPPKKKIKLEKPKTGYGRFKIVGDIVKELTCICIEFTFVLRPATADTWTIFEIRAAKVPCPLSIDNFKKKLGNLFIKDKGIAMDALEKYKTSLKLTVKSSIDARVEQYTAGTPLGDCLRNVFQPSDNFIKLTYFTADPAMLGDAPLDASALDAADLERCLFAYQPRDAYWNHANLTNEKKTAVDAAFVYHDAIRRCAPPFNSPALFDSADKKWPPEVIAVFKRNADKVIVAENESGAAMLRLVSELESEKRLAAALSQIPDLKIVRCEDYSESGGVYNYIQNSIAPLGKRAIIYSVLPRMESKYRNYINAISCSILTYAATFKKYTSAACMLVIDRAHLLKCAALAELVELARPFGAVMLCGSKLFYPRWSVYPFRGILETALSSTVHNVNNDFPYNLVKSESIIGKLDKAAIGGAAIIVANAEIKARYGADFPDKKKNIINAAMIDAIEIPPRNVFIILEGMREDTLVRAIQWTCNIPGMLKFVGAQTNVINIVADARGKNNSASPFEKTLAEHMF